MLRVTVFCLILALSSAQFSSFTRRPSSRRFQNPQPQEPQFVSPPRVSVPIPERRTYEIIPIVRFDSTGPEGGFYNFLFETGDGVFREESGAPDGPNGAVTKRGGWRYTAPDGTAADFTFEADENGYRVNSPLLPQGPEIPEHALEQIRRAEEERARGITHDGQWDAARYGGSPVQEVHSFVSENRRRFGRR